MDFVISIHALREEGDAHRQALHRPAHPISIHALREEGDRYYDGRVRRSEYFYPRPPRGGRLLTSKDDPEKFQFLSTPSARRATHPLQCGSGCKRYFYPRPPRGGRQRRPPGRREARGFLSTPSARRETAADTAAQYADGISIHALREEGDLKQRACFKHHSNFYPRPPRGGRLALLIGIPVIKDFYPRPPRGGRLSMPLSLSARRKFLSTPSARRATSHTRKSMS